MSLKEKSLFYHKHPEPGKLTVNPSKPSSTQEHLKLAYSPGVAEPVKEIMKDPLAVFDYTIKGELVGVVTDGSAVLGLGNVGPLASKPVMEGKALLFKRFGKLNAFDIEINADTMDDFIKTVVNIAPTFGGINLEDIKAPECFYIEKMLNEKLNIPVLHDDQHGTAIVIAAGLMNALEIQNKKLQDIQIVCLGAGAAGIASMNLLLHLGLPRQNLKLLDSKGVIHSEREDLNPYKKPFALKTQARTVQDALQDADVFIGVAGPNLLNADDLKKMAPDPIVFALSNPDPEIEPKIALAACKNLILATGRSDYPNQINNVLCFPYLFRGALDARASCINTAMQIAAVNAIRQLTHAPITEEVKTAYPDDATFEFGPYYILPKPTDSRLFDSVSKAVFQAAKDSGVSCKPKN